MISHKLIKQTRLLFIIIVGIIVLAWTNSFTSRAQSTGTIRTDLGVYPIPPAPPLPAARGKLIDPTFGTEIMRVTDASDGQYNGTEYSYWPTLNCNSTRILVASSGGIFLLDFDPTNFVIIGQKKFIGSGSFGGAGGSPHTAGATWSTTDPDVLYSIDNVSLRLMSFNVATMQSTLLRNFAAELGALGPVPFLFQLSVSEDNDVFAATIFVNYGQPRGYVAWRRSTNQILLRVNDVSPLTQNEVRVDKTGRYLFVQNDGGVDSRDVWDLQTATKTTMLPVAPDYVPSHYDLGAGFIFAGDAYIGKDTKYGLNVPRSASILLPMADWAIGKHYSMLAANDSWGLISSYYVATPGFVPTNIFRDEVYQLATDGTGRVRRLLHHHSIYAGYYDTPRANISRDGQFIAFSSNWGVAGGRRDLFIAKIPPADGSMPSPTPTATPTPSPTATPTPSPTATPTPNPTATPTPSPTPLPSSSSVTFVQLDTSTKGNWKNSYGVEGHNTVNESMTYPSYAQVSVTGYGSATWTASTTDIRGLQKAVAIDRVAARWDSTSFFTIDLNITDGQTHRVAVYSLDWDGTNRIQRVDLLDGATNALLDSRTLSSFNGGQYLVWDIRGRVKISVNRTGAKTAVVSGLYFGGPMTTPSASPTPTPTPTPTSTGRKLGRAKRDGQNLSNQLATLTLSTEAAQSSSFQMESNTLSDLQLFVAETQETYSAFNAERQLLPAAARIDLALTAAVASAAKSNLSATLGDLNGTRNHLREAINHLELSDVLISYGNIANPIDVSSYIVRQHYVDFLNREPDQAGSDFWISQLQGCGADSACVEGKRVNTSAAFFLSIESQQTGYFVYRMYKSSYGRVPLMREYLQDQGAVARGVMVGTDGWAAQLAANQQAFIQGWTQRADFQARYAGLTNEQFLAAVLANLGVIIPAAERNNLLQDLANGMSRGDVLGKLVENQTFSRNELSSAFVLMQYFGYLRRDPDAAGYNFWLNKLNAFGGNYVNAEMVKAFLRSTEYRSRFGL